MIATGRSLSLASALVALALLVIKETPVVTSYSAYVSDVQLAGKGGGEEVPEGLDGKRNASDSVIRVPLLPGRRQDRNRRSIDTAGETVNEYQRNGGYGRKSEGNATASGNKASSASDMSAAVSEAAKKNHKKLKLAQMRGKNSRIKEHSIGDRSLKEIGKRHADYNTGGEASVIGNRNWVSVDQAGRNRDADYYARRRAVMEKYYARQQEIATKYADQGSTTARPISRYDLLAEINTNNVSAPANVDGRRLYEEESAANRYNGLAGSFATQAHKQIRDSDTILPGNGDVQGGDSDYYDDDYEEEPEITQSPQSTQSTQSTQCTQCTQSTQSPQSPQSPQSTQSTQSPQSPQSPQSTQSTQIPHAPETNIVRGNCLPGTLIYQHDLHLHVDRASSVETDIHVSLGEWYCIACISVQSPKKIQSNLLIETSKDSYGGQDMVKLTATSTQEEHLHLDIKILIVRKTGDHCDPIEAANSAIEPHLQSVL